MSHGARFCKPWRWRSSGNRLPRKVTAKKCLRSPRSRQLNAHLRTGRCARARITDTEHHKFVSTTDDCWPRPLAGQSNRKYRRHRQYPLERRFDRPQMAAMIERAAAGPPLDHWSHLWPIRPLLQIYSLCRLYFWFDWPAKGRGQQSSQIDEFVRCSIPSIGARAQRQIRKFAFNWRRLGDRNCLSPLLSGGCLFSLDLDRHGLQELVPGS